MRACMVLENRLRYGNHIARLEFEIFAAVATFDDRGHVDYVSFDHSGLVAADDDAVTGGHIRESASLGDGLDERKAFVGDGVGPWRLHLTENDNAAIVWVVDQDRDLWVHKIITPQQSLELGFRVANCQADHLDRSQ